MGPSVGQKPGKITLFTPLQPHRPHECEERCRPRLVSELMLGRDSMTAGGLVNGGDKSVAIGTRRQHYPDCDLVNTIQASLENLSKRQLSYRYGNTDMVPIRLGSPKGCK